jgi:hypothetical protein
VLTLLISMMYGHQNRSKLADSRNILTAEDKLSLVAPAKTTNSAAAAANTNAGTNATSLLSTPKAVEKP